MPVPSWCCLGMVTGHSQPNPRRALGSMPVSWRQPISTVMVSRIWRYQTKECNSTDGSVTVLLGNGDGTFNPQPSPPGGSTPSPVTAADFNRDGIPDLAVPNIGSNSVSILLGNGDGTFTAEPAINLGNNSPDYVGVGDLDGNGTQDLVIANRYTSGATGTTATVMLNQITATATAALTSVSVRKRDPPDPGQLSRRHELQSQ